MFPFWGFLCFGEWSAFEFVEVLLLPTSLVFFFFSFGGFGLGLGLGQA